MTRPILAATYVVAAMIAQMAAPASAQIVPAKEPLSELYTGKVYSPYAQRSFPERPLWGDSHLHTAL